MICGPLGTTGLDGLPLLIVAVLAICLIVGGIILVRTQRRRRHSTGLVAGVALLALATLGLGALGTLGASPASAAVPALTITQTSVLTGFEPGDAPLPIFGTVTNNCNDDTFITDIEVSITAVTLAAGAPAGTCTVADFVLLDPVMPVDLPLPARGTIGFSGASLGLVDAIYNQDACQGATVELLYITP